MAAPHVLIPVRDLVVQRVSSHSLKSKKGQLLPSKILLIQVWENITERIEVIPMLGRWVASRNGGKVRSLPTEFSYRQAITMFK